MTDEEKMKYLESLSKGGARIGNLFFDNHGSLTIHNHMGEEKKEKPKVTDEHIGNAILAINGEKKPLNEKQLFLGVICVLLSKYGWTGKFSACCNRINELPMKDMFEKECDYNSIKVLTAYKFASVDYKDWETYEPSSSERMIFKKCKAVADAFDEAILMQEE